MTQPSPVFRTRLAASAQDIAAAQRLRYSVFVRELGACGGLIDHAAQTEADRFDPFADHLLLADATILNKLSPFFVSLFAGLFLAERLGGWRLVGMLVAFSGAALVIKPQLAFAEGGVEALLPAMVGLGSAMLAGAAYTLIRAMKGREASATIVLHFSLVSSVVTLVPMLMNPVMPSGPQALALLGIGIFAAGGQILMTTAYRLAPAGEVSIYSYLTIVFSALAGWAIWGEVPDIASLIGFVLIAGVALIGWHASRVAGRVV